MSKWLLSVLFAIGVTGSYAQTVTTSYSILWSHREVNPGIDNCPNPPDCHSRSYNSWDVGPVTGNFKEGNYTKKTVDSAGNVVYNEFLNFRAIFPPGYSTNNPTKYPMIIMLHGAGEGGRIWSGNFNFGPNDVGYDNNGKNITHGGQEHHYAVFGTKAPGSGVTVPGTWPGIVIWPQVSYNGAWESGWQNGQLSDNNRMAAGVVEYFVNNLNVDPDRIVIHGLSNGAQGVWDLVSKRPDLFAAMAPMSGVGTNMAAQTDVLVTTPIWMFQGGVDTNPNPQASLDWYNTLVAKGGTPLRTVYPTLGHGTWQTAYQEPNFFPWLASKSIKNIFVFGGTTNVCPDGSLKLGFTANFLEYKWFKDGVLITTDGDGNPYDRYLFATQPGVYTCQYRRFNNTWGTSNPVTVNSALSNYTPVLTNTGSTNLTINKGGVDNRINFIAPLGFVQYNWFRNGAPFTAPGQAGSSTSSNTIQISNNTGASTDQGLYTVSVKLSSGCTSQISNGINVTWVASQPTDPKPAPANGSVSPGPAMTPVSPTRMDLSWPDYSDEAGYELWRYEFGGTTPPYASKNWRLVTVLPENTTNYSDLTVRPNELYNYVLRAILRDGRAIFSEEPWVAARTPADVTAPTPPSNLVASAITDNSLTLSWSIATDNDLINKYEIFNGSTVLATVTGSNEATTAPATSVSLTGLSSNTNYLLSVRALDYTGNYSPFSQVLPVSTIDYTDTGNTLEYRYYTYTGTAPALALYADNSQTPTAMGVSTLTGNPTSFSFTNFSDFRITVSSTPVAATTYILAYEGLIDIQAAGSYTFRTTLNGNYANQAAMVQIDNDGSGYKTLINQLSASPTQVTGSAAFSAVGKYKIRILYRKGHTTTVSPQIVLQWTTPSSSTFANIPLARFFRFEKNFYFLKSAATDLTTLANWNTVSDGSGANLSDWTTAKRVYVITKDMSLNTSWPISGASSRVVVGNGSNTAVTLSIGSSGSISGASLEAAKNATINVASTTLPSFTVLDKTSTVTLTAAGSVTVPSATYGNLNLNGAAAYTLSMNNVFVMGNMNVANGATTAGATTNLSTLNVAGNLVFNNTSGNPLPASSAAQYALAFTGGTTHTFSFVNPVDIQLFSLTTGSGDVVNIVNSGTHTYTFGSSQGGGLSINGTLDIGANNLVVTGRGTINAGVETGSIAVNGGDVTLNTTATQNSNLQFHAVKDTVNNLTLSVPTGNQISVLTDVNVKNLVTISSGTISAGAGNINLISKKTGTARIGPLTNGARISGSITAQRYMDGEGRIYRYISSPVKGVKAATLQSFFPITGNFTGASTIPGVANPAASMFWYAEPTYQPFPPTGGTNQDTLRTGRGYTAFIREGVASTTWEVTGAPNQGTITYTNLVGGTNSNNGWNLIGNPYPAPIKWTGNSTGGWTMSGVNVTVSVRENSGTTYQWKTWNGSSGNLTGGIIAPGQAFWVQASTANPSIVITEAAKQTTDGAFLRTGPPADVVSVKLRNATLSDDAYIQFDRNATTAYEKGLDAIKQDNSFFNVSTLTSDNQPVAINMTTSGNCDQEVKLRITNAPVGTYSLDLSGITSLTAGETVVFTDAFTNTSITLAGDYTHTFSITSDPASIVDGRFKLKFTKPTVDLAKTLTSQAACNQQDPAVLVAASQPGVDYTVFLNGVQISQPTVGNGTTLSIPVDHTKLTLGKTEVTVKAGFLGCSQAFVPGTVLVRRDTLVVPVISMTNGVLSANLDNVQYQWFKNGELVDGATNKQYAPDGGGSFTVSARTLSCDVPSESFIRQTVITSIVPTSEVVCNADAVVNLPYAQTGATYTAYVNDVAVSQATPGTGWNMNITLDPNLIGVGEKQVVIKAKFPNDVEQSLTNSVLVNRSVLGDPTVLVDGNRVSSSVTGSSYRWFFEGMEIAGVDTKEFTADQEGHYAVEVVSGSCMKTSPALSIKFSVELDQSLIPVSGCDDSSPAIRIEDSQPGVQYTAMYNSTAVSSTVVGTGSEIVLTLDNSTLGIGEKNISVQAGFANNTQYFFPTSVKVRHDVLPQPKIAINAGVLSADVADAQYAWFLNGVLIPAATSKNYQPTESGSYTVVVTSGSCTKTSAPVDYAVTAIEDDPSYVNYSPNPTRDRLVVTTGIALDLSRVKMMSTLGQGIGIEMRRLSERSAELNLSDLSAGLYLLQVNGKTYRIVKE